MKRFERLPTLASGLHTDWQADLAVLNDLANENENNCYILVCIDVFSRKLFTTPVKTKSSEDMIQGFERIFKQSKFIPWQICTDGGKEFTSHKVQNYFKTKQIKHFVLLTSTDFHAGVVERANRTLKERIYRYFTNTGKRCWIKVLPRLTNAINNSINRTLGRAPNDITFENAYKLSRENCEKHFSQNEHIKLKIPLKIGQHVRVGKFKNTFEKGYLPNFTDQIYTISRVRQYVKNSNIPITYKVVDEKGKELKGWCYSSELSPVVKNEKTVYRIDKILRKKKKNGETWLYVQWTGYDDSYNSWICEKNLL